MIGNQKPPSGGFFVGTAFALTGYRGNLFPDCRLLTN
jgi:hypothetical protein